jgi:hypothetical protein
MKKIGGAKSKAMKPFSGGKAMKTPPSKMDSGKAVSRSGLRSTAMPVGSAVMRTPSKGRF